MSGTSLTGNSYPIMGDWATTARSHLPGRLGRVIPRVLGATLVALGIDLAAASR